MTVMNLDQLGIWSRAKDFALIIYKEVVPHLPADEKWNLAQQLKRAAQSIPANIAEGHGRFHFLDNVRFCYIARGSLTETQSHLSLAHELGYLPKEIYINLTSHAESIGKQLNNYIAYLKRSKQGEKEFPAGYTLREESVSYIFDNQNEDT
ncbi:MAG: 30S ribosomal protein S23 [Chloroflexi bacterium OLB14]|nr:MAG: 30S ribosomal protein S23 [Chloroflexi bacterium OLB14]